MLGIVSGHVYGPHSCCLCSYESLTIISPIPGTSQKIDSLRARHQRLSESIAHYEERVADQAAQLARMNRSRDFDDEEDEYAEAESQEQPEFGDGNYPMTEEDMRREEEEIRELEQKKKNLEERVGALGRDLTGVLR